MNTATKNGFSNVAELLGKALEFPAAGSMGAPPDVGDGLPNAPAVQAVTPSLTLVKREVGEWFGRAFEQICAACPSWRYSLPTDEMVKSARVVWIQAFAESGITTKKQVGDGIRRLARANRQYLPTVADFIAMCKDTGEAGRWPDLDIAKKEILMGMSRPGSRHWSCRFVAELAGRTGSILHPTTAAASRDWAFEAEYLAVVALAEQGVFDQPERKALVQDTDPNVAYYFQLLRDFPQMPALAGEHLKACAAKGILIEVDLEHKTGTVTRPGARLVGEKVVAAKREAAHG